MAGQPRSRPSGEPLPAPLEFFWTVKQIAVHHQLSEGAVRSACEDGELGAVKTCKEWRVADSAYRKWLRDSSHQGRKASAPMLDAPATVSFFPEGQNG